MWADVERHVRSMPEQPALLFPSTEEWKWTSWSSWREEIRSAAEELSGVEPGSRVGFGFRPEPRSLTRDLAIQMAGGVSVPAIPGDSPGPGEKVDLWWSGSGLERVNRRKGDHLPGEDPRPSPFSGDLSRRNPPRVLVEDEGSRLLWGDEELEGAVRTVDGLLVSGSSGSGGGRELAYLSGCPRAPWERAYFAWCLETGAALVLAGDRELTGPGFLWSRPTLACLGGERLLEVEATLRSGGSLRRLRRRFRRLHTLLLWGPVQDLPLDRELWDRLGVRLARPVESSPLA